MAAAPNISTFTKFAMGTANPPTNAFEWLGSLQFGKRGAVFQTGGIRGTRSRVGERTRDNIYTVGGSFSTNPGPADLDLLLYWLAGTAKAGNDIALAETVPEIYVAAMKGAQQYLWSGCKLASGTLSATQGGPLTFACQIEGKTETAGTVTGLSALTPSLATPYMFYDASLTIGGTTYQFKEFNVTIDNGLKLDRFMNSVSRTDLPETDRSVSVSLGLPFTSDTLALYDTGATGAAVNITLTNGTVSLLIAMPYVQFPAQPHEMPGRDEILLPLSGQAMKSGSSLEVLFTNDSTP